MLFSCCLLWRLFFVCARTESNAHATAAFPFLFFLLYLAFLYFIIKSSKTNINLFCIRQPINQIALFFFLVVLRPPFVF